MDGMITRRNFLKMAGFIGFAPIVGRPEKPVQNYPRDQIRVLQGPTNSDSSLLSIFVQRGTDFEIEIKDTFGKSIPYNGSFHDVNLGSLVIYQIFVGGLLLNFEYTLSVHLKSYGKTYRKIFKALDWSKTDTKIALMSCANHRHDGPKAIMFKQLFESKPEVIFFPGDLVYGNSALDTILGRPANPEDAYELYTKTVMEFELYNQEQLIPVFSSWDDHDLAQNNADGSHPHKDTMLKIFRSFFPMDARIKGIQNGPGTSFVFEAFGFQIFFFDARFNKNEKAGDFLGAEQVSWFSKRLSESQLPKMLICPLQFWQYGRSECYQRNPGEFQQFLNLLKQSHLPAVFFSGDTHYSQIQEVSSNYLNYKTFEITSSAMFSISARSSGERSPREGQLHYYGFPNFILLDKIKSSSTEINLRATCMSEQSKNQFSKELVIK